MAEPPKFTPKKRPKSCMQTSDEGSDSTVEDLCRKKFKPIAPKPFLQKDSHQSMLTTVLPVKQPPQSDTKDVTTFSLADTNTNNVSVSGCSKTDKCRDENLQPSMPVMYGGPVFIPVRFPFPVLVPAMFNVNGNQEQKCTCSYHPSRENKPSQPDGGINETKQQACPVHYNFKSSQPTYINTPVPNVQSSFMPMYMSSGSSVVTKGDWSGKPKYNRYKYSMLKNGDIYKGMACNFQGYADWNQSVNCSQLPGDCLPHNIKKKQFSGDKLYSEKTSQSEADNYNTPCSVATCKVPSKCDTMCQTSLQNTVGQSAVDSDSQQLRAPPSQRVFGVDAAVQTDTQEIEAGDKSGSKQMSNNVMGKRSSSTSNVQCSLQESSLIPESENDRVTSVTCASSSPSNSSVSTSLRHTSSSEQGTSTLYSSSAFTTPSHSSVITSYGSPASNIQNNTMQTTATAVPSRSNHDRNLPAVLPNFSGRSHPHTSREGDENNYSSSQGMQRVAFSSESEISTSSQALQQRNYETDVIVPLRAAPSPSDAHDSEDMDRFVLSPVISESDSEDIYHRPFRRAGFFRQPQDRQREGTPSLLRTSRIPSVNPIRAGSLSSSRQESSHSLPPVVVPGEGQTLNRWPTPLSKSMQEHGNQFCNGLYHPPANITSVGFPVVGADTATLSEHRNPYTSLTHVSSDSPMVPNAGSPYQTSNPVMKEQQNSLLHPAARASPYHPYSATSSLALPTQISREFTEFPAAREVPVTGGGGGGGGMNVTSLPVATNKNQSHSTPRNSHTLSYHVNAGEGRSKSNSDNRIDKAVSEASGGERFGVNIQSVPLQSNVAGPVRGETPGQRQLPKDNTNVPSGTMEGPSQRVCTTVGSSVGVRSSSNGRYSTVSSQSHHRRQPTDKHSGNGHLHNTIVSSSTGYPVSYVPPIGCHNNVPPMQIHEPSTHSMHGFSQHPISGTGITMHGPMSSGLSPRHNRSTHPHSFQPGGRYHGQYGHMYYPHYRGLHQPLGMSANPAPSHSDLSLLSPRSCAHLHIHGNMLHSPQMPSSMHNFQRPPGFTNSLHAGAYPYSAHKDRLDTCCSGRVGHSPPREDRSIPTLLTNILHRKPGAFSHLEQTAYVDHTTSPTTGSQPVHAAVVTAPCTTVTSSINNNKSPSLSTSNTLNNASTTGSATFTTTDVVAVHNQSGKSPSASIPALAATSSPLSSRSSNNTHSEQCSSVSVPSGSVSSSAEHQIPSSGHQTSSSISSSHPSSSVASPCVPSASSSTSSSHSASRGLPPGNSSDKYLPVEAVPPSPASSSSTIATPDNNRQTADQVIKYGETVLKCSRQILRESGRTVLCCWSCDYHTAEPRKMHRHQKKETQLQKCQLCDYKADTRCKVNQHYKEVHMDKDDPFRSVNV